MTTSTLPTPHSLNAGLHPVAELVGGLSLAGAPGWVWLLQSLSLGLSIVAALGGGIVAWHGVYRIVRSHRRTGHW